MQIGIATSHGSSVATPQHHARGYGHRNYQTASGRKACCQIAWLPETQLTMQRIQAVI